MNRYKYIIYRLYNWRLKNKDLNPELRVVITMSILHCTQLLLVYEILITVVPSLRTKFKFTDLFVIIFFICFIGLYALLFYRKEKWKGYIEQFKNETPKERRRGTIILLLFTIGTIVVTLMTTVILGTLFW